MLNLQACRILRRVKFIEHKNTINFLEKILSLKVRKKFAFSLAEMMIVMFIMSLVAAITVPLITKKQKAPATSFTLPIGTRGGACKANDTIGITSDHSTILTCQSLKWFGYLKEGNIDTANMDTVTDSGAYRFNVPSANSPGFNYGQLLVMHGAGDTITQIAGDYATGNLATRSGNPSNVGGTGSWSAWKPLSAGGGYGGYTFYVSGVLMYGIGTPSGSNFSGTFFRYSAPNSKFASGITGVYGGRGFNCLTVTSCVVSYTGLYNHYYGDGDSDNFNGYVLAYNIPITTLTKIW